MFKHSRESPPASPETWPANPYSVVISTIGSDGTRVAGSRHPRMRGRRGERTCAHPSHCQRAGAFGSRRAHWPRSDVFELLTCAPARRAQAKPKPRPHKAPKGTRLVNPVQKAAGLTFLLGETSTAKRGHSADERGKKTSTGLHAARMYKLFRRN